MRKKCVFLKSLDSFGGNQVTNPLEVKEHRLHMQSRAECREAEDSRGEEPLWTAAVTERLLSGEAHRKVEFPEVGSMNDRVPGGSLVGSRESTL